MRKVSCDKCGVLFKGDYTDTELEEGPVLCDNCEQNATEDAYERMCEDFHEGGSTAPWPDVERKRMEEARKLK